MTILPTAASPATPDPTATGRTSAGSYRSLPAQVNLPELDREVIGFWADQDVFQRTLQATVDGPRWTVYEGPPTANGRPGTHHIEARVFKDVFPRYKTMQGYHVPRRAGWDCHGLPVELAVEKELGFTGKSDIEAYGVAEFNARCRESVQRHVGEFEAMSARMGYWADYDNAYWTMNPAYIESVWWALKQIFDRGLLVEDYRVAPYCPRCGTTLSDHEVAQGYEDVVDPSVFVRFPLTSGPWADRADLLVWTTTPWTLVSNTAVAVNPNVTYVLARSGSETFVIAEALMGKVLSDDVEVLARYLGRELERWTYRRPYDYLELIDANYVVLAEYVTVQDGTGLVHQAPAFGADDLATGRAYGLPVLNPIGPDGRFRPGVGPLGGVFFKDADEQLVADLGQRGLLLRQVPYAHTYPHCWRCHTPLMYYALPSWYVRTTQIKDRLAEQNETTNWFPETIKHGRYGDWLDNNVDWALSRDRYWGTPLPIWRNDADPHQLVCVGSLAELARLSGRELAELDPHRPFVDEITFDIDGQAGTYRRVPQVIDAWFDSGSMPFAQFGAPHRNAEQAQAAYPADFICEAIDQTRGWFYTLMAIGTLVFDRSSYRNVLCLGHILAEDGRKMSKHLGNILEPMSLMDRHGADAVRWFMLAGGSPWSGRRVGHKVLEEIASKVLRTYWSVASFQSLYARANEWSPLAVRPAVAERASLDRWALSGAHALIEEVSAALDVFDTARAGRALAAYIDDLSNWYVRRSRRRFWDGDPAALATLHECLDILTRLLAPFVPFISEAVWGALFAPNLPAAAPADQNSLRPDAVAIGSVHLAAWPTSDPTYRNEPLRTQVALVRRLVELGRAARAESAIKTRQPLARALVSAPGWTELPEELRAQVREELNVVALAGLAATGELIELSVKPNFRALGQRFGGGTQAVAAAIAAADPAALVAGLRAGTASVLLPAPLTESVRGAEDTVSAAPGGTWVSINHDEVIVTETPRSGWAVSSAGSDTVALDLELTPELRLLGLVRDVVRFVQEARKDAGLQVTDRIELWWQVGGSPEPGEAIRTHQAQLAQEVLAATVHEGAPDPSPRDGGDPKSPALFGAEAQELGLRIWLRPVD